MIFDYKNFNLVDDRKADDKVFNGGNIQVCYTLNTDDITKGEKPRSTPYKGRYEDVEPTDFGGVANATKSTVTVKMAELGVEFTVESFADNLSEYGVYLPFNFMGKFNGGGWENQYLLNSTYISNDKKLSYIYLTKPNGNNLLVAIRGGYEGWKVEYSAHLGGHYFVGVKLLANFDRAYNTPRRKNRIEFAIIPVDGFDDAMQKLWLFYGVPFLDYERSGGKVGDYINLKLYGKADGLKIKNEKGEKVISYTDKIKIESECETFVTPLNGDVAGAEAVIYGYEDAVKLYKKATDSVDLKIVDMTDGNLCEHQCWGAATLRYLLNYKDTLTEKEIKTYEDRVMVLLDRVTETDPEKAVHRQTILPFPYKEFPAYNVFKSRRIQEQFFGVTLLLDAYKYFGDEKYYTYAKGALDCLIDNYQQKDGRLQTNNGGVGEDYTTVCCAMIPFADMANFTAKIDKEKAAKYYDSCARMANYLYGRGLKFPTEGGETDEAEDEMEDGSISCTALALLYYCKNVKRVEEYIVKAKEILDVHESWVINTPICQMKNSSLRWWETQWEGDADGPAVCAGHAWTIWRAEADFLYYSLTKDKEYCKKAFNGVMSNLSKIRKSGVTYSIYNPDMINGGGFADYGEQVKFRVANRFADREDCGLSRYVFIRLNDMKGEEDFIW